LVIQDVYSLKNEMRKAGEIAPAEGNRGKGIGKSNGKSKPKKLKKGADEFQISLVQEIQKVESEIDRLNNLAAAYDKTNSDFAASLDTKIEKETRKLTALREFQNN